MSRVRNRQYQWDARAYRRKAEYRAAKRASTIRSDETIQFNPDVAFVNRANIFTLLNTFEALLVEQRVQWKDGIGFTGEFTHANGAARAWSLPNISGGVGVVVAGGTVIQSGSQAFAAAIATVTFPVAYSAPPIVVGIVRKAAGVVQSVNIQTPTTTQVVATRSAPAGVADFYWLAIGVP